MSYYAGSCDVAVIGAGHAGIEAALAAARLGNHIILFTINLDAVGNMPCNPAIGGTGKGHLVRELDALGGEMGAAADHACIQYRMLNRGKGPAVHSLRAQADRVKYRQYMKHVLELQENLELKQAQIVEILTTDGAVTGVRTQLGAQYGAKAVVIATGTYLGQHASSPARASSPPARDGMHPSVGLADNLRALGLSPAPLQNRHATPCQPPEHRFFQNGGAARGRDGGALLLPHHPQALNKSRRVLPDLHQRGDPPHHPGEPVPQSHV